MANLESVVAPACGDGGGDPGRGDVIRSLLAPLSLALLAGLTLAMVLGLPERALAVDAPEGLDDMAVTVAGTYDSWSVESVQYVSTTADEAAALLGKRRDQLDEDTPERIYLVVMRGDFRLPAMKPPPGSGQDGAAEQGPYLAFLFWRRDDVSTARDLTVLQEPVQLGSVGEPRALEPFALMHPTLQAVLDGVWGFSFVFLPAVLLALSAVLVGWKRRLRWPHLFAAAAALVVAAWQTYILLHSMSGQSWDPVFHGIKLAILAVVVSVDLAAALALLKARSKLTANDEGRVVSTPWTAVGLPLLVLATLLYLASWYWLATTGE